eukprot:Rhum_TRINITY_DN14095_c11_g1::Rhum_TRINITY_DN14095_c11_g1_i1::g.68934::m.68934
MEREAKPRRKASLKPGTASSGVEGAPKRKPAVTLGGQPVQGRKGSIAAGSRVTKGSPHGVVRTPSLTPMAAQTPVSRPTPSTKVPTLNMAGAKRRPMKSPSPSARHNSRNAFANDSFFRLHTDASTFAAANQPSKKPKKGPLVHNASPSPTPHKKNAKNGSLRGLQMCPTCGSMVSKEAMKGTKSAGIAHFSINPRDLVIDTTKVLGQGGFGVVYLGDYQATEVAVKVMLGDKKPKPDELEDWKKEVEIMTHLRHPNILSLLGCVFSEGKLAIVTEYCAKGSLRKMVKDVAKGTRFEVTWARKLDWLIQVSKGLAFLHHKKIHHRDLKASNVFISGDTMKIADFGLSNFRAPGTPVHGPSSSPHSSSHAASAAAAAASGSGTPPSTFAPKPPGESPQGDLRFLHTPSEKNFKDTDPDASGTFAYVAPEVWAGKSFRNASDVYAFGVMVIEVLTTRIPFDDVDEEDEPKWARRIRRGTARPVLPGTMGGDTIPETLVMKTRKILAYHPKHRPEFKHVVKMLTEELDEPYTFTNCPVPYDSDDEDEEPAVEEYIGGEDDSEARSDDDGISDAEGHDWDGWNRGEY